MNKEHTEYLFDNFPNLYAGKDEGLRSNLMGFGFDCGDGWFDLLRELSEKLEPLGVKAMQVKEKMGTLRFYLSGGTDEAYDLIDKAEAKSEVTCEVCGEPGTLREGGWLKVRCDDCYDSE